MRRLLVFALVVLSGGCFNGPRARTGFRFEVLRPPVLESDAIVQSSGNTLGILGSGCGGLRSEIAGLQSFGGLREVPSAMAEEEERFALHSILTRILQRLDVLEREVLPRMPPAKTPAPAPQKSPQCP